MQDISLIPGTLLTLRGFEMQLEMSFINRVCTDSCLHTESDPLP